MTSPVSAPCPCGRGVAYAGCCGRWHQGAQYLQAPTAEALMRSRYVAFVQDRLEYLQATWHPKTRPLQLEPNPPGLRWLGLQVKQHRVLSAHEAEVHFVARNRWQGRGQRHEEISRFVREQGQWFYVDGQVA